MNNKDKIRDRIFDAYMGEMGHDLMRKTHKRLYWICSRIKGKFILDVGCSQGIVPILLGREGFVAIGIDSDKEAIAYARKLLASEEDYVKSRVDFIHGDITNYDFSSIMKKNRSKCFDTIIVAEVLEHFIHPKRVLDVVTNILDNKGLLIITVPFGINEFIDHKKTFYMNGIIDLIHKWYEVKEVNYLGSWVGIVAERRDFEEKDEKLYTSYEVKKLEEAFYNLERGLRNIIKEKDVIISGMGRLEEELKDKIHILERECLDLRGAVKEFNSIEKDLINIIKEKDAVISKNVHLERGFKDRISALEKKCFDFKGMTKNFHLLEQDLRDSMREKFEIISEKYRLEKELKDKISDLEKECFDLTHVINKEKEILSMRERDILSLRHLMENMEAEKRALESRCYNLERKVKEKESLCKTKLLEIDKKYKESLSYQLGYIILNSKKFKYFFSIPVNLFRLYIESRKRKRGGSKSIIVPELKKRTKIGLSILTPCKDEVSDLYIESLKKLNTEGFDVQLVVVINNTDKEYSAKISEDLFSLGKKFNVLIKDIGISTLSQARNTCIDICEKNYIMFLDADDGLEENYLVSARKFISAQSMVINDIVDYDFGSQKFVDSPVSAQLRGAKKRGNINVFSVTSAITMNACKIVPSLHLKKIKYEESLKSGEDVVFFTNLLTEWDPEIHVVTGQGSRYIRSLSDNSVSRRKGFSFYVEERLQVINCLAKLRRKKCVSREIVRYIDTKIKSQASFIRSYINDHPEDFDSVVLKMRNILDINVYKPVWRYINKNKKANALVVAYCFPPFNDPSSIVCAKRLSENKDIYDVIYCNMNKVRKMDFSLDLISSHFIRRDYIVDSYPSFSGWDAIKEFIDKAIKININKDYDYIYSRSLWMGSHFAAMFLKEKLKLKWTAEFSDPHLYDIDGNIRYSEIDDQTLKYIYKLVPKKYRNILTKNAFMLAEVLPYILADRIVFTNSNQREYMLSYLDNEMLRKEVLNKSIISPHPMPEKSLFELVAPDIQLPEGYINTAYFGSFYSKRTIGFFSDERVIDIMRRNKIKMHIFTNSIEEAKECLQGVDGVDMVFSFYKYMPYVEYLSLLRRFDVLLLIDSIVSQNKGINPYLPSKLSDYIASETPVWAIVDESTAIPIDKVKYISKNNKIHEIIKALEQISKSRT